MTKKKGSRKSSAAKRRRAQAARKTVAKTAQAPKSTTSSRPGGEKQPDFATEYRYVLSDLKRFAILAVAMFATLIILALVLR